MKYSFLCGQSYAWQVGYKPKTFDDLEKKLIIKDTSKEADIPMFKFTNPVLVGQIQDCYQKLGFLFFSRDAIRSINGIHENQHVLLPYYLYNFIFDGKAFLDAVAVLLNDFYIIGKIGGEIDFKFGSFRDEVIKREPKLKKYCTEKIKWFDDVISWRESLIHKFSTLISPYVESARPFSEWPTSEDLDMLARTPCKMLREPRPIYVGARDLDELRKKYGTPYMEIDPFCTEWINNSCELFDNVCLAILEKI